MKTHFAADKDNSMLLPSCPLLIQEVNECQSLVVFYYMVPVVFSSPRSRCSRCTEGQHFWHFDVIVLWLSVKRDRKINSRNIRHGVWAPTISNPSLQVQAATYASLCINHQRHSLQGSPSPRDWCNCSLQRISSRDIYPGVSDHDFSRLRPFPTSIFTVFPFANHLIRSPGPTFSFFFQNGLRSLTQILLLSAGQIRCVCDSPPGHIWWRFGFCSGMVADQGIV